MNMRALNNKYILAAREEGMSWRNMDAFDYDGDIFKSIEVLRDKGYKIFYLSKVQYAIDTILKNEEEK
ncbi:hypothetical protein [Melghirimyces algeriensis]|uniref:Uncharacterized protein n=1 Tax=Melghirimyces algeriensis TaxID=910412 RepID=A0A521F9H0_9BACL|nr:hypothetical protein [Melghirimyces algeriensis]SMO92767.1 hypothetical protein SAMN06264849_1152 [Melghirimyces algeriensis]